MNKAVPWSIKGVDFDARTAAKEAARRAGMTLGEWLNSVIAEQAAEQGIDPDEIGEEERVAAVRSQLERMSPSGLSPSGLSPAALSPGLPPAGNLRRRADRPGAAKPASARDERDYDDEAEFLERPPRKFRSPSAGREAQFGLQRASYRYYN